MMQHIARCLNPAMSKVCEHVLTLETLTAVVRGYFTDDHVKSHCTVTSFNKGCLVLTVSNAMWASQLRYQLPALRDYLRQHAGLHQLITLKLNINLEHSITFISVKHQLELSSSCFKVKLVSDQNFF